MYQNFIKDIFPSRQQIDFGVNSKQVHLRGKTFII